MLLTESSAGRVAEVTPNGRTVWEWVHAPYEESNVPVVTKAARHDLTREDVATWPCSSADSTQGEKRKWVRPTDTSTRTYHSKGGLRASPFSQKHRDGQRARPSFPQAPTQRFTQLDLHLFVWRLFYKDLPGHEGALD